MWRAYKILYIFRPLVWAFFIFLIGVFGMRFKKKLLNGISIFLALLSLGGVYLTTTLINDVIDAGRHADTEQIMQCIVGSFMTMFFIIFSIGYMLAAKTVKTGDGKDISDKSRSTIQIILGCGAYYIAPLAFFVFSIPLLLLEEVAGKIVGGLIMAIAFFVMVMITKNVVIPHVKEEKRKIANGEFTE